jgi:hypothetical protein
MASFIGCDFGHLQPKEERVDGHFLVALDEARHVSGEFMERRNPGCLIELDGYRSTAEVRASITRTAAVLSRPLA